MNEVFNQNPAYTILAILGTVLFVLKMALFLIAGDGGAEADLTDGGGIDGSDGGDSFSLVSTQSILAFLMGTGWIGLAAKQEWMMDDLPALLVAVGFGTVMLLLNSFLTFKIKGLNSIPVVNMKDAIGKTGRAYTNIPKKGAGIGQVEITVGGKQQILQASSSSDPIKSFDSVIVESVDDSGNLIVKNA
jgi:hypothetical protein